MWGAVVVGERVGLHEPGQMDLGWDVRRWIHAGEVVRDCRVADAAEEDADERSEPALGERLEVARGGSLIR